MFRIGWFSTGKDKAARDLLAAVKRMIECGEIPDAKIEFVFCNREKEENKETDLFLRLVRRYEIPLVTFSSAKYNNSKQKDLAGWRRRYDSEVKTRLKIPVDLIILAGYMLIVSPEMCQWFNMINLHPAAPGGPTGTWQEVIWKLIERKEKKSGVVIHLVTPELDAGLPVTFCTFPLDVPYSTDNLWRLRDLFHEKQVEGKLFNWIRTEGLKREFPLIVATLKILAEGKIKIQKGQMLTDSGEVLTQGCDLTSKINTEINKEKNLPFEMWRRGK